MTLKRQFVWLIRSLVGLVVFLCLVVGIGLLWLRGSLPDLDGEVTVAGLTAPVEILRDDDGIVTIRAQTGADAAFALGFAHAQDRLWQMDFMRRTGAGRVSEVVGPPTFRLDRFMRTLGLYRLAEASYPQLTAETRAVLDAYSAGVNAFMETHDGPWPPEFYLLRYRPEPWRPADSLVWGRLMALQLSGNWSDEIRRFKLAKRLSPEQVEFLWPDYPADAPISLAARAALVTDRVLAAPGEILPWSWAPKSASNTWAVAGARTMTGKPFLANDPHLALNAPGIWYLARIETPGMTWAGATAPGVPFMVAGHNGHIAWGHTTTEGDTQDLFIEKLTAPGSDHYVAPDGPLPFETRSETIEVRGEDPVDLEIRATRHGPVISDVFEEAEPLLEADHVIALAWPALRPEDRTADALFQVNHATTWDEFLAAMTNWHSPQQTISYADTAGNIGLIAPALVPIRKAGDGRVPVPGWTGEHDWEGFLPFGDLPRRFNPPNGQLVAANNRLVPDDFPHLITADWRNPFRARRIEALLDGKAASLDGHKAIQNDIQSGTAQALLPVLLEITQPAPEAQAAYDMLVAWDGTMDRADAEPLLFYAWTHTLNRLLLQDELERDFADFQRVDATLLRRMLSDGEVWCDDTRTPAQETCAAQSAAALAAAVGDLKSRFGRDIDAWQWGEAHQVRFPHRVLSHIPLFREIFGFDVASHGGSTTVNRGGVLVTGGERLFENIHGPGYRAIYDLADPANSRFMIATGASGNPLSPFYGNLAARWADGLYLVMDAADDDPAWRLALLPK